MYAGRKTKTLLCYIVHDPLREGQFKYCQIGQSTNPFPAGLHARLSCIEGHKDIVECLQKLETS